MSELFMKNFIVHLSYLFGCHEVECFVPNVELAYDISKKNHDAKHWVYFD